MDYGLYLGTVLGALALLLMMPRARLHGLKYLGALLGACTLGGLWLWLAPRLPSDWGIAGGAAAMTYYYVFSAIGLCAATRVITHTKPVYAALWFVLVVLASAGLFLLLGAEFMAFAMVIIYGGAILVTYVFVIMLAAQAGDPAQSEEAPAYERLAWEPVSAIAAGFLLMAMVLSVSFPRSDGGLSPVLRPQLTDAQIIAQIIPNRAPQQLERKVLGPAATQPTSGDEEFAGPTLPADALANRQELSNVERIGLDLFQGHVLALELAGVILLVSLVGAVVIARQKVEDETPGNQSSMNRPTH